MDFKLFKSLIFAAIALSFSAFAQQKVATGLAGENDWMACPTQPIGSPLKMWRDTLIKKLTNDRNYKEVQDIINYCFPDAKPKCFSDLNNWLDQQVNPNDYTMTQQTPTLNSVAQLPSEFRNSQGQVVIPENILELAKTNPNILVVSAKSLSGGVVDEGTNLLAVGISTPTMDIVMQVRLHDDAPETKNAAKPQPHGGKPTDGRETMTIITRDKTKVPQVGQMRRLTKSGDGYTFTNNLEFEECLKCHTAPFRPYSPQGFKAVHNGQEVMSAEQKLQVDAFNRRFLLPPTAWGTADRNGKSKIMGPAMDSHPLGWAPAGSETRKEEFLKVCATSETKQEYKGNSGAAYSFTQNSPATINYDKLAAVMNCTECHNNNVRGKLHERLSDKELNLKILVDQSMPPNQNLTMDERIALVNCIKAERTKLAPKWRASGEWMTGVSCFVPQFATPINYVPNPVFDPNRVYRPSNNKQQTNQQ